MTFEGGILEVHPLAACFPSLPTDRLADLGQSIQAIGQLEPITVLDNQILDGRNRYEVCRTLGIEPILEQYTGSFGLAAKITGRAFIGAELNPEEYNRAVERLT